MSHLSSAARKGRSRLSYGNGMPSGVGGGTEARRFRDVIDDLTLALHRKSGGYVTDAQRLVLPRIAACTVTLDRMNKQLLEDEIDDLTAYAREYARLSGVMLRSLSISLAPEPVKKGSTLEEYVAATYPELKRSTRRSDGDDDERDD